MAYIGNQPISAAFLVDTFNGNGSTVAFTLSVAPANTSSLLVAITGVLQDPSTYAVAGTTLTFSQAPPAGTGNISVRYLGIPASGVTTTAYRTVTEFTATAGQTTFNVPSYTVGFVDVYDNGVRLGSADYTATSGTTVVLASAAVAGDLIVVESFLVSSVLNAIPATAGAVNTNYIANAAVTISKLSATGAPSASTFLRGDNTWAAVTSLPGAQGQVFTGNGTFTIPTGITAIKVTVVGGGGGSGGCVTNACTGATGGNGGGGGTAIRWLTGLTPGGTITVVVGAGGTAAAAGGSGGAGGNSSVASGTQTITTVTGNGGGAGLVGSFANGAHGAGGAASGGDINISGSGGAAANNGQGGAGVSLFSTPVFRAASPSVALAGTGRGGGAAGPAYPTSGPVTSIAGAAGSAGIVIFEW